MGDGQDIKRSSRNGLQTDDIYLNSLQQTNAISTTLHALLVSSMWSIQVGIGYNVSTPHAHVDFFFDKRSFSVFEALCL